MMELQMDRKRILLLVAAVVFAGLLFYAVVSGFAYVRIAVVGLPFLLVALWFAVYQPRWYAVLLVLALPVSLNLEDIGMGFGISLPGEIMVLLMAALIIINLLTGRYINTRILKHPVTIAILVNLVWMGVTSLTSTMPLISAKYMIMRIAYLLVFYLFFVQVFSNVRSLQQFVWLYAASLLIVIAVILLRHAQFGFIQQVNAYVAKPFFKDHTIYGASVAMLLPFFAARSFISSQDSYLPRALSAIVFPLLLLAAFLSYSRAVWLSIAVAIVAAALLLLKVKLRYILLGIAALVATLLYFREPLMFRVTQVQSERGSDIREHATSIANLNTSASNLERINRWETGIDMFFEKPSLGFGPGTYPFQYAPYQDKANMTRISTYFGDKGGVHSEYLKPLSESGWPGLVSFLAIILLTAATGLKLVYYNKSKTVKLLAASFLLGLTTYYTHGFVNFFLHTDKVAVLFWGMTAGIVALDMNYPLQRTNHSE